MRDRSGADQAFPEAKVEHLGGFARTFEALRYRDFRYLWLAQITSAAANWMQMVALPILVLVETESPVHLGLVLTAKTVPALALGLFSGVFADIWNRRKVLLFARYAGTAVAVWFAVITVAGWVTLVDIYIFASARGAAMAFDQAPRRAMIPTIVPRHVVVNAMALLTGGMQMMRVLAAGLAGVLIAVWGLSSAWVVLAALYVAGIPLLLMLRVEDHERTGYQGLRAMVGSAKEGLSFALYTPSVRATLMIAAVFFIFGASFMQVFAPLLAQGPLGLGEGALGGMIAVMGAGGTAGTLLVAYAAPTHHRGLILIAAMSGFGILLAAFAGATYLPIPWVAFGMMFVVGLAQSIFMPLTSTVLLQASPDNMRGRAMSLLGFDRALVSFGSAIAGFASAAFGPQQALLGFGAACVMSAILLLSAPSLRKVD